MLLSPLSLDTSPVQDLTPDASGGPPAGASGPDSFASRLAEALGGHGQGQHLAAEGAALTRLPLGPSLEVITVAGTGVPDADSLAAFATGQGLDPEVVAWLFGKGAKPDAALGGEGGEFGEGRTPGELAFAGLGLDGTLQAGMLPPPAMNPPTPATASTPTGAISAGGGGGAGGAGALLSGALIPAAGWLMQQGGLSADASEGPATAATAAVTDAAGSFAAAQAQAQALGRTGPGPKGASTATDAQFAADPRGQALAVEILSLEIDPYIESLLNEPLDDHQTPAPAASANQTLPPLAGAGGAAGSLGATGAQAGADALAEAAQGNELQQRADALQALAQRLGEAVGQRVLGQIARGNWSMKLMLKPATLGHVEIDLRMRAGELDASFRSINPMTRELLADGLPRLREVLAGAGMDIAGLHVGHGSGQSAGGNPTPRQAVHDGGRVSEGSDARDLTRAMTAQAQAVARRAGGDAGWDVLV